MSNHPAGKEPTTGGATRQRWTRALVVSGVLVLGIGGGLAACGDDDDDASDTVPSQTGDSVESSAPGSEPSTTRASSTSSAPSTTAPSSTSTATTAGATSVAGDSTAPADTDAADGTDAASTSAASTTAPAGAVTSTTGPTGDSAPAVDSTSPSGSGPEDPSGSGPETTAPDSSGPTTSAGPTTTGPVCEYTENDEFPLQRCDAGPPIAALQSVLQSLEYQIGTVDCLFGDQTAYAVVAFQTDEELPADGVVDAATWTALEVSFLAGWGTDTDGSGSIEPSEITLTCA